MSETRSVFKLLVQTLHDILSTAIEKLEDNLAQDGVLPWLGIEGSESFTLPAAAHTSMENIGQFIELDDTNTSIEAFAAITDDLVIVFNALDDYVQIIAGGLEVEDLGNAFDFFIEWCVLQSAHSKKGTGFQTFLSVVKVLGLMAELPGGYTPAGTLGLFYKSLVFGKRFIQGFYQSTREWSKDTRKEWTDLSDADWEVTWQGFSVEEKQKLANEQVKLVSDVLYFLLGAALYLKKGMSNVLKVTYGFDPPEDSITLGDQISERVLTLGFYYKLLDDESTNIEINYLVSMALQSDLDGGIGLEMHLAGSGELALDIGKGWKLHSLMEGIPNLDASLKASLQKENEGFGWLLGDSKGTRLALGKASLSASASVADKDLDINIDLKDCMMVFARNGTDSFLQSLIPAKGIEAGFDFGLGFSINRGFYVNGGAGFSVFVPLHSAIGPITVDAFYLKGAEHSSGNGFLLETSVGFTAKFLGITVSVQQIGLWHHFTLPEGRKNLQFVNYEIGVKPPELIGLSVQTDALKGGGFIEFNAEKGEYTGALELSFDKRISFKALAIISTKLPDGSKGYSMLILFTAEGFHPVPLGLGFELTGLGGLVGLNRTAKIDVLRQGIKTNSLKSILFPENVVANAARIISDLRQVFPATNKDTLVICPVLQISWGPESLVRLEIGVLIDTSFAGFVIFGVIKAVFPDKEKPVLQLQVNFVGVLDLEEGKLTFNASLYDSRLLTITLLGDFGLYISWGADNDFLLSAGGFHPSVDQEDLPTQLKNMQRLTISLLSGANPRATLQGYLAITTNSVQFGARVELYAASGGFNVFGYVAFDTIFRSLNELEIGFEAGLALRRNTNVLMGIRVKGVLAGTEPWDLRGSGSISFFFFSISVPFHARWGTVREALAAVTEDLMEVLRQEIARDTNWSASIPANNSLHVSIKKLENVGDSQVIHPLGVLTFSQTVLPLHTKIQKFGSKLPKDADRFEIKMDDPELKADATTEQFAAGNFLTLTDTEKLSRPSFEPMASGFRISGSSLLKSPMPVDKSVTYEFSYLGRKRNGRVIRNPYIYNGVTFKTNSKSGAISRSSLSHTQIRPSVNAPMQVAIESDHFAIANLNDLKLHGAGMVAESYTEVMELYNELVKVQPELKGRLRIVAGYELNLN